MTGNLKSCPFCNGDGHLYEHGSACGEVPPGFVACTDCGANVHESQWNTRPLESVNADLLEAAKRVLAGLNGRIDNAPKDAVPVFDGIADLHDAISLAEKSQ